MGALGFSLLCQGRDGQAGCVGAPPLPVPLGRSPHPPPKILTTSLYQQQNRFYSSVKTGYTIGYGLSLTTLLVAMAILSLFR